MRLAAPAHLVDVNWLAELDEVAVDDHRVRVGAIARHARVEHDAAAAEAVPLLAQAIGDIAHDTVRNRGTVVGSLVHADPAAELPAVLALLEGTMELASAGGGRRRVAAADFFLGPLESAARPGELALAAEFPRPPATSGSAWIEVARRHGDYAVCGVGTLVELDGELRVVRARAACISVGAVPVLVELTDALAGRPHDAADWAAAGRLAAAAVDPEDDIHASAAYRRHLAGVLTARAARAAAAHAASRIEGAA
jgi:carbon-monoxide dehydrogenase medium subunit